MSFSVRDTMASGKPIQKLAPKVASEVLRYNFAVVDMPLQDFNVYADNFLLSPIKPEEKTKGGIILTSQTTEVDEYIAQLGRIEAVGEFFYQLDPWNKAKHPPKVGDYVVIKPYVAQRISIGGELFLVAPQTAILARFSEKEIMEKNIDFQLFT